jgi:MFS family permease
MNRPLLIGLLMVVSLHAFDELVLVISLPAITAEMGGEQWYGLCLASYMLAALVSVAWAGDWIDRHGPSNIFRIGMLCFVTGLVMSASAPSMPWLIAGRVLQGVGGGIGWTVAYSVANRVCTPDQKSRMVALLDSAWLIPSLLAPVLGGILVDYINWQWVFIIQLPFVLCVMWLLMPSIKNLDYEPQSHNYDSLKNALWLGALCLAIMFLISQPLSAWWLLLIPLTFGLWWPLNRVLPQGWLQLDNPLAVAVVFHGIIFFAFFGVETFIPLFLIEERQFSTLSTGLLFTGAACSWVLASFSQSYIDRYISHRRSMIIGNLTLLLVMVMVIQQLNPAANPIWMYVAWMIAGFGMGLMFNSAATAGMLATKPGQEGATATATGMAETLAIALASGAGGAIKNQVEYQGGDLSFALLLIWLLMAGVFMFSLWVVYKKFPVAKNWY